MMTTDQESLVAKWRPVLDAADHIFTWTEPLTAAWLAEQASRAEFACEVGVYMGYTSFVMLKANPHLHLWSIDPFQVAGTEKTTRYFLREFIAQGRCEIIPKFTKDVGEQLNHMAKRIDLAFVDDGHQENEVTADIGLLRPLIRPGGLLAGHDLDRNPENDVTRTVKKLLPGFYEPCPRLWAWIA